MKKYKKEHEQTTKTIQSRLSLLVLLGAQKMVQQALEAEVTEYLGRQRYERQMKETEKHYRNGLARERRLTAGCGSFGVRVPRLREQYTSAIVDRYQRLTPQVTALIPQLYMHGLASGDFQQCFHALLGSEAPLSESSILQQKQQLESEYQAWKKRPLEREYLYVWADGVADLWKALRDVFPTARRQRCWVHKMRNVLDKVPLTVHDEVLQALREIYHASDEKTARSLVQAFATRYRHRYPKAVACLEESLDVLFSYFYFPWKH
jgi:transposase-like protein